MLNGNLYNVNTIDVLSEDPEGTSGRKYNISLLLNGRHDIFSGHFPGNPVLPGVCQVEMVREMAGKVLGSNLLLSQAAQIKYLNQINPLVNPSLLLTLKLTGSLPGGIEVSAELSAGTAVFMKMKGRFTELNASALVS